MTKVATDYGLIRLSSMIAAGSLALALRSRHRCKRWPPPNAPPRAQARLPNSTGNGSSSVGSSLSPDSPRGFRETLGKCYDWGGRDVVLYDDMAPDFRIARSPEETRGLWETSFQALRHAHHLVLDGPETIVGDDLATSTLEFGAPLKPAEGQPVISIRARSTLVWRCTGDAWKIVSEHNSTRRITSEETRQLFGF